MADLESDLADLRTEAESLNRRMADRVLQTLEEHGLAGLIRWHLTGDGNVVQTDAKPALPERPRVPKALPPAKPTPKADRPKIETVDGRSFKKLDPEWKKRAVAGIVDTKDGTPDRTKAFLEAARTVHEMPGGRQVRLTLGTLKLWVRDFGRETTSRTKRAAPAEDDESEGAVTPHRKIPKKLIGPEMAEWREKLLAPVFMCRRHSEERTAAKELLVGPHDLPGGGKARLSAQVIDMLVAWVEEQRRRRDPEWQKRRAERLRIIGHPVQVKGEYDNSDNRNTACPAYSACLTHADEEDWDGFSCLCCYGPGNHDMKG